jgi:hypothetical protein
MSKTKTVDVIDATDPTETEDVQGIEAAELEATELAAEADLESEAMLEALAAETEPVTVEQATWDVLETVKSDRLTLYAVAGVLNAVLEIFGVMKDGKPYQIRTQAAYNYGRNGMVVPSVKDTKPVTKVQAAAFVIKYVSKRI